MSFLVLEIMLVKNMPKPITTYANTWVEPMRLDIGAMVKAIEMVTSQPDIVKKIALTTTNLTQLQKQAEPLYKDVTCVANKFLGVQISTDNRLPENWALLDYQSGKRVMLNLIDGRTFEVPQIEKSDVMYAK